MPISDWEAAEFAQYVMMSRKTSKKNSLRKKAEKLHSKEPEAISKVSASGLNELIHKLNNYRLEGGRFVVSSITN